MPDYEAMILDRQERLEIWEEDPDWVDFTEEEREIFSQMAKEEDR